jgi:bifunctional oligoribonuclease and PAP phosphatase NrnA
VNRSTPIVQHILQTLRRSRSCCVVGHVRPDGDCIGSQLALTLALEAEGKSVACWNVDPIPSKLAFLDPQHRLGPPRSGRRFDCVIATDCASLERLGHAAHHLSRPECLVNIDHHASNTGYGHLNWIDPSQPSTGGLIHHLLQAARWPITPAIADCLFTAISTDTGSFQFPSTRPSTLRTAAQLLQRGANLERISREVYHSFSLARVELLRLLYQRIRLTHHNQIAHAWIKKADYARTGADPSDAEGLIDHLRSIQPVLVACLFEETEPRLTRISLRSKHPGLDVNRIASEFGGGGHPAAAGARIPGPPATVQRRVLHAVKLALPTSP